MKVVIALLLSLFLLAPNGALAGSGGNGNGNGDGNGIGHGNGHANGNGNGNALGHDKDDADTPVSPLAPGVDDQNAALTALQSGAALPLSQIIPLALLRWGGRVIDAMLVRDGGALLYQLTIINDQGVSRRVFCDARSGNPIDNP